MVGVYNVVSQCHTSAARPLVPHEACCFHPLTCTNNLCRVDVVSKEINTDPNRQLHDFRYSKAQPWVSMKVARWVPVQGRGKGSLVRPRSALIQHLPQLSLSPA
jgi:hypothetical protein